MPLDRERIVAEAVALLDESGLEGVTLRKLAARLDVQAPTLYWHIKNKAALINAISEAILSAEFAGDFGPAESDSWQSWLTTMAGRLRRAMLAHPDGARVVSAAQMSTTTAAVTEVSVRCLVEREVPLRQARLTVLAVLRFTIGHVLEEQAPRPGPDDLADFDMAAFTADHPTLMAALTDYFRAGVDVETLFHDTLAVIIPREPGPLGEGDFGGLPPGRA